MRKEVLPAQDSLGGRRHLLLAFLGLHILTLHDWGFHEIYRLTSWDALSPYQTSGLFHPDQAYTSTSCAPFATSRVPPDRSRPATCL